MQLWQQILISVLSQEEAKITFPDICQNCRGKMLPSPKKDQRNPRRLYPRGWRMLQTNWGCRLCPWGIGQQCRGPSRFSMIRPFFPYHREKQYFLYDKNIIKNYMIKNVSNFIWHVFSCNFLFLWFEKKSFRGLIPNEDPPLFSVREGPKHYRGKATVIFVPVPSPLSKEIWPWW